MLNCSRVSLAHLSDVTGIECILFHLTAVTTHPTAFHFTLFYFIVRFTLPHYIFTSLSVVSILESTLYFSFCFLSLFYIFTYLIYVCILFI